MRRALRWALVLLCLSALAVGVPALLAPASFYRSFPLGMAWVEALPPYNEHLVRDVGGLYLGFAVLFGWAAVTLERALVAPVCVAWCVFSAAHLTFHVAHASGAPDVALQVGSLAAVLVLALAVLWAVARPAQRSSSL
jgi:hypothetical protein